MPFPATFLLILSLLLPAFPARPILTIDNESATWHNFANFLNLQKGSQVNGISQLKEYFQRFGYLPSPVNLTDIFDSELETALLKYQKNLGLPVTGNLDPDTINLIMSPRCGVGDSNTRTTSATTTRTSDHLLHKTQRYAYFYGHPRWVKSKPLTLTYAFSKDKTIDYISRDDIRAVFSRAFTRWARVIPVSFKEIDEYSSADIKIGFYSGDHGDGEPFDGVLGVLAHAFSPENGRLHLDRAEMWSVDFEEQKSKSAVDLESVATHEIGHILGLAHSSVRDSIMYPSLSPRSKKVELRIDDVEGVQALYGSNPDFKFSSLLASEKSFSSNGGHLCWKFGLGSWVVFGLTHFIFTL